MRINEAMNLVVPIYDWDDQVLGHVHSIPLSRVAFEAHYKLLSLTFSDMFSQGFGHTAGPRIAALIMRDIAAAKGIDPEPLLNEIRRLSCFIRPGAAGWEQVPLHEAINRNLISEDDAAAVMSALVLGRSPVSPELTVIWVLAGGPSWGRQAPPRRSPRSYRRGG